MLNIFFFFFFENKKNTKPFSTRFMISSNNFPPSTLLFGCVYRIRHQRFDLETEAGIFWFSHQEFKSRLFSNQVISKVIKCIIEYYYSRLVRVLSQEQFLAKQSR